VGYGKEGCLLFEGSLDSDKRRQWEDYEHNVREDGDDTEDEQLGKGFGADT
jgi:hypothetical protein